LLFCGLGRYNEGNCSAEIIMAGARTILRQLGVHSPFTALGAAGGVGVVALLVWLGVSRTVIERAFWTLHPAHVLLSAMVTAAMYRLHSPGRWWRTLVVGYVGAVGIATLSDCVIPYLGELLVGLPHSHPHVGAIDKWWLVNPLALAGVVLGYGWPHTKVPHAGHVLLSMAASLVHIAWAMGPIPNIGAMVLLALFLFLAVWVPCCTSDIVFPLLFTRRNDH
jgi:hypothetical protein